MDTCVLLINLHRSSDRLAFQRRQLARVGVSFERVDAIDAGTISEEEFAARSSSWQRPLSRNEVGCFLSHRLAWLRVVADGRPRLIMEDDALVSEQLAGVVAGLQPPSAPVIFNLEAGTGRKLVARQAAGALPFERSVRRIYYDRGGSAAYVITPQAAEICLTGADRTTASPDAYMNHLRGVTRFQIDPALAVQMSVYSEIAGESVNSTARSTITRQPTATSISARLFRRPRMKLRRLKANLLRPAIYAWTVGRAEQRRIAIGQEIIATARNAA